MVGQAKKNFQFEQKVMEEFQALRVYYALASSPPVVAISSHIGGDEEGRDSITSTEVGAWLMPPLLSSSLSPC